MIAHCVTMTLDVPEPKADEGPGHEFADAPIAPSAAPPQSLVAPWMHGAMPDWLRDACTDMNKLTSVANWGYKKPLSSTKTYKVVMIRHGESEWNKENRFCGWFDAGLSAKGIIVSIPSHVSDRLSTFPLCQCLKVWRRPQLGARPSRRRAFNLT